MSSPSSNNVQLSRPQSQQSQISDQWSQPNYPYPYQRPENQHPPYQSQAPSMPYQYGQLPYQPTIQSGRLQHPLPGSYSRQSFNPQTRSFVPANGLATGQSGPFVNRGNDSSMLNMNMAYQSGNQAYPYVQQPGNYNQATPMPIPGTYNAFYENKTNGTRKTSGQQTSSQSPGQSTLSKWGTPANLPPKPPPPEAPSMPEGQNALPVNFRTNMAMQPMSNGGQSIPNFQNGTYSLQGAGIR
ncbi:hypothetical protein MMC12_005769 [Toensbergia leucococca]|nr:hypothetical protein [Toensbergia leucococca]